MAIMTELTGNEIFCLAQKGYSPGNFVIGNAVYPLGFRGEIGSELTGMLGKEIKEWSKFIKEGRAEAYNRMMETFRSHSEEGVIGVTNKMILHPGQVEFVATGSLVESIDKKAEKIQFSTCSDGKEFYSQIDAGYRPLSMVFGNVVYSVGLAGGIIGKFKAFARGEVEKYSKIFNRTRSLALERIMLHAKEKKSNSVVGIRLMTYQFSGVNELLMTGTASYNQQLPNSGEIITSNLSDQELWSLAKLGYAPIRLLQGTSIFSFGLMGSVSAAMKSFNSGEITELSKMLYSARKNALSIINNEADNIGAEKVVGIKSQIFHLGNGLIDFYFTGTAIKKMPSIKTDSDQLPSQAIIMEVN